ACEDQGPKATRRIAEATRRIAPHAVEAFKMNRLGFVSSEQIGTSPKKVRGMSQQSLDLIEAMYTITAAIQPVTGRGVGYKLFTADLIPSMVRPEMKRVYRLLLIAREQGIIPWEWIVDETRELERCSSWTDPAAFVRTVSRAYRRDFWNQQPKRV